MVYNIGCEEEEYKYKARAAKYIGMAQVMNVIEIKIKLVNIKKEKNTRFENKRVRKTRL